MPRLFWNFIKPVPDLRHSASQTTEQPRPWWSLLTFPVTVVSPAEAHEAVISYHSVIFSDCCGQTLNLNSSSSTCGERWKYSVFKFRHPNPQMPPQLRGRGRIWICPWSQTSILSFFIYRMWCSDVSGFWSSSCNDWMWCRQKHVLSGLFRVWASTWELSCCRWGSSPTWSTVILTGRWKLQQKQLYLYSDLLVRV